MRGSQRGRAPMPGPGRPAIRLTAEGIFYPERPEAAPVLRILRVILSAARAAG
jgi:hypothetical protein